MAAVLPVSSEQLIGAHMFNADCTSALPAMIRQANKLTCRAYMGVNEHNPEAHVSANRGMTTRIMKDSFIPTVMEEAPSQQPNDICNVYCETSTTILGIHLLLQNSLAHTQRRIDNKLQNMSQSPRNSTQPESCPGILYHL